MTRLHVDEVDVEAIDLRHELRERVQPRREPLEVIVVAPIASECLKHRQLHALRRIGDGLFAGKARSGDALAQVGDLFFGQVDAEGTDCGCCGCLVLGFHTSSPLCCYMTDWPCEGAARQPRTAPSHGCYADDEDASTSMIARAKSRGASCGRLCPTPPVMRRCS